MALHLIFKFSNLKLELWLKFDNLAVDSGDNLVFVDYDMSPLSIDKFTNVIVGTRVEKYCKIH